MNMTLIDKPDVLDAPRNNFWEAREQEPVVEPPTEDHLPWRCIQDGCDRSFEKEHGLTMHMHRSHASPEVMAERALNRDHKKNGKAKIKESLTPEQWREVREMIAASIISGTHEYVARRKRWSRAKSRGLTASQFEVVETERFAKIVRGEPTVGVRIAVLEPVDEHARADAMFAKVAAATRALVEADEMFDRFEEVAELRRYMFEFLARR